MSSSTDSLMNLTYKLFLFLLSLLLFLPISILSLRVRSLFFSNLDTYNSSPLSILSLLAFSMHVFAESDSSKHTKPKPLDSPFWSSSTLTDDKVPNCSKYSLSLSSLQVLGMFLTYRLLNGVSFPSLSFLSYLSTMSFFPLNSFSWNSSIAFCTSISS